MFARSFAVKGEGFAGNGEYGPNPDTNGQSPSFGGKLDSEQSEYMTFLGWIDFTDEDRQRAQEYLRSLSDADQIEPQFTELADQYQRLEQCVGNEIDLRDSKRHPPSTCRQIESNRMTNVSTRRQTLHIRVPPGGLWPGMDG